MAYIETNRAISAIFVDLGNRITTLIRKEGQLARAEMSEKLGEIGIGSRSGRGGPVLLIPVLVILLEASPAWPLSGLPWGGPAWPSVGQHC
jgi:hypothetical protein